MAPSVNLADLGQRVRAARLARRLTLEEVVSRANFTVSWLSKLENGQLTPSLEGLVKLADVLECGVDSLVAGLSVPPRYVAVKDGAGRMDQPARDRRAGVMVEHRAEQWRGRGMNPVVLHISGAGSRHGPESHPGERFLFVIEGELRVDYGDELILLSRGDSVYLHASIPHTLMPATRGVGVKVLSVVHEAPAAPRAPVATKRRKV
ncbi:MAG: XRE family transcriptional regulator [Planctomycetia bacterium]|nr:XRE family transcriptional regulator [Planctomycetia bacterium]